MTPKEKAEDLVLKFKELPQEGTMMFYLAFEISKQCALITVNELIKQTGSKYWYDVKLEIKKL